MKKLILILLLTVLLSGCGSSADIQSFKAYRGQTAATIFTHAEYALAKGDYGKAAKDLQALDAIYPFGPYAQQGQLDIIYAYYKNGAPVSALAAADRYIRLYPRGRYVSYAYYMKGLISFSQGGTILQRLFHVSPAPRDLSNKKQAFLAFKELITFFPNSPYAADAALRMYYIRNLMAKKQVDIAKFYLKRKAYVAAANRAAGVVAHFEGTPAVIPALAIMVKSYRALDLHELAHNSLAILQASYPDAKVLKKLAKS